MMNPKNCTPIRSSDRYKIEVEVASDVTTHTTLVCDVTGKGFKISYSSPLQWLHYFTSVCSASRFRATQGNKKPNRTYPKLT